MEKNLKTRLISEKKAFDILGLKYLSAHDKKNAFYVSDQIAMLKTSAIPSSKVTTLTEAFVGSIKNLSIFGNDTCQTALSFASAKFYPIYPDNLSYATNVTFDFDEKNKRVDPASGTVDHFKIPTQIDYYTGEIFLSHELIHALKETNYQEYINIPLSDVIPLFYELVLTEHDTNLQRYFLYNRLHLLNMNRQEYLSSSLSIKNSKDDKDLYKIVQTRTGEYLNSYYYSLILYNMYKSNPKLILSTIKRVLNHEITTLEMLIELGIYEETLDNTFNEELSNIKRIIK